MTHLDASAQRDIQGILLSGYGHLDFGGLLFVKVHDRTRARHWLTEVLPDVTSSERWDRGPDGELQKPPTALNVALTYPGAVAFGLPEQALATFSLEFRQGMVANAPILGDVGAGAPDHWDMGGGNERDIHLMLMIFAVDQPTLEAAVDAQKNLIRDSDGGVELILVQQGARPKNQKEPFGFRDGVSNPIVQGTVGHPTPSNTVIRTGEFILGYLNEYDVYPLSPTVRRADDPQGILPELPDGEYPNYRDLGRNGSYLVYRKLEQDVENFWRFVQEQHTADGEVDEAEAIKTASKFVGRWPSGAPLVLTPDRDDPSLGDANDFDFSGDRLGFACPIASHIRRSNPRDSIAHNTPEQSYASANTHRILRRAFSYGGDDGFGVEHEFDAMELDGGKLPVDHRESGGPRGIHFMAVNADIRRQFELVQQNWCNNPAFNAVSNNRDPIIGDNDGKGRMTIPIDPIRGCAKDVPRFVTTRGGGYYFLPSLTALQYLAQG